MFVDLYFGAYCLAMDELRKAIIRRLKENPQLENLLAELQKQAGADGLAPEEALSILQVILLMPGMHGLRVWVGWVQL